MDQTLCLAHLGQSKRKGLYMNLNIRDNKGISLFLSAISGFRAMKSSKLKVSHFSVFPSFSTTRMIAFSDSFYATELHYERRPSLSVSSHRNISRSSFFRTRLWWCLHFGSPLSVRRPLREQQDTWRYGKYSPPQFPHPRDLPKIKLVKSWVASFLTSMKRRRNVFRYRSYWLTTSNKRMLSTVTGWAREEWNCSKAVTIRKNMSWSPCPI
jgi:hypothetical protein